MKYIPTLLLFLFPLITFAQNLVQNPSFEAINACPSSISQLHKANFWTNPADSLQASPDLFHVCGTSSLVTVPTNFSGSQFPHTGDAYAGIITTTLSPQGALNNYREYLQGALTTPLSTGENYIISFWVSPSDYWKYGTPKLGLHLRNSPMGQSPSSLLPITPQLTNDSLPLDNTSVWTKLEWTYNAVGGERFFIIGHFDNDTIMNLTTINPNATGGYAYQAYSYIDDVSIETEKVVSLHKTPMLNTFNASPNPANNVVNIDIELSRANVLKCSLLNALGQFVRSSDLGKIKRKQFTLDVSNLANGIYFVQLVLNDSIVTKKIVVQH